MQIIMLWKWMMKIWLIYEVISDPEVLNDCRNNGACVCTRFDGHESMVLITCVNYKWKSKSIEYQYGISLFNRILHLLSVAKGNFNCNIRVYAVVKPRVHFLMCKFVIKIKRQKDHSRLIKSREWYLQLIPNEKRLTCDSYDISPKVTLTWIEWYQYFAANATTT